MKGKVTMLFITHALPKALKIDEVLHIGKDGVQHGAGRGRRTIDIPRKRPINNFPNRIMMINPKLKSRVVATVATLLALTGCASGPPFVAPEPAASGEAQVYVYRKNKVLGGAATHWVAVDGTVNPPWLANGAYLRFRLTPGRHSFTMTRRFEPLRCGPDPLVLELNPGQTVYVEAGVDGRAIGAYPNAAGSPITIMNWSCAMTPRSDAEALPAITGLKRMD